MFSVFTCANNVGNLVNNLFEVKIFNPFSSFGSSSLPSGGGIWSNSSSSSNYSSSINFYVLSLYSWMFHWGYFLTSDNSLYSLQ